MRPLSFLTIVSVGFFAFGCQGVRRPHEIVLKSPSGLQWVKLVAKGIE